MQRIAGLTAVAVICVLAGCSSAVSKPSVVTSSSASAVPSLELPSPTPTPSAFPTSTYGPSSTTDAVAFASPTYGWGVGSVCTVNCTLRVAITDNGGQTWGSSVAIATLPFSINGDPFANVNVRFQGANGWISGPNLYASHDNGHAWRQALSGPILALEPYENETWAVRGCGADDTAGCLPRLMVSPADSDNWSVASPQPHFTLSVAAGATPFVVMERAPRGIAFVAENIVPPPYPTGGGAVSSEGQLLFTSTNLGRSWQSLPTPCSGIQSIRSTDGVHVWILCAEPCCTGNWVKSVWTSADGGRIWSERSGTDPIAKGSIPFSGTADSLTVTTNGIGVFGGSNGVGIWRSSNSGITWDPTWTDICIEGGDQVSQIWFATPLVGWAVTSNSVDPQCASLLRTINSGSSWTALRAHF